MLGNLKIALGRLTNKLDGLGVKKRIGSQRDGWFRDLLHWISLDSHKDGFYLANTIGAAS